MENQDIYKMKLHEVITTKQWVITRVCGGWIYQGQYSSQSTAFVPFDNEFMSN